MEINQDTTWQKYTLTAVLGAIVAIGGTFGNVVISTQSRVAALEARANEMTETMHRIENKLDTFLERKR